MSRKKMKTVLSIAGSDSGGGAGIQADLKTISAHNLHALTVVTAVTAQNSVDVIGIQEIKPEIIEAQLKSVFQDFKISAVKIGMVSSVKIIKIISDALLLYKPKYIVLDPVMVAQSGAVLIKNTAISALKKYLLPLATISTPNIPEFVKLFNNNVKNFYDIESILKTKKTNFSLLIKGGHFKNCAKDLLFYKNKINYLESNYVRTKNLHGTGCTLSSAIASNLVIYNDLKIAVDKSKKYLYNAIMNSYKIGQGAGPVHHLYKLEGIIL
jgi:hydroxymethylpyrimidine/phosphomethylpyrimidine kinase